MYDANNVFGHSPFGMPGAYGGSGMSGPMGYLPSPHFGVDNSVPYGTPMPRGPMDQYGQYVPPMPTTLPPTPGGMPGAMPGGVPLSPFAQQVQTIAYKMFGQLAMELGLPEDPAMYTPEQALAAVYGLRREVRKLIGKAIQSKSRSGARGPSSTPPAGPSGASSPYPGMTSPGGYPSQGYPQGYGPGSSNMPTQQYLNQEGYWPGEDQYEGAFGGLGFGGSVNLGGVSIAFAGDRQVSIAELGGGLRIVGEIHPAVASKASAEEIGCALHNGVVKAMGNANFGADGDHWTSELGAACKPCKDVYR